MREDLESRLERLLGCSSQRLSKLGEIRPGDIRELRKALGLLLRYLQIKHPNPRLRWRGFSRAISRHQENLRKASARCPQDITRH
jgi:hypothetical protein